MIKLIEKSCYLIDGKLIPDDEMNVDLLNSVLSNQEMDNNGEAYLRNGEGRKATMSYDILSAHNISGNDDYLNIKFDAMASHDITYVGIVQTAKASGLTEFPLPYVLTNCHNSLCAVGGTINEDDHVFGLSAAKKYGGIYVPAHQAVIHQYMREEMAGCGKMILGSDSHTRYGALGTMGVGEGGPELVKQLLKKTWDNKYPDVIAVYLKGSPIPGVGPQDVALSIIGAVFKKGFVKNKVMEFVGPGIDGLSVDFRNGIDVMTTETTCLSSIWKTDDKVQQYYEVHGRKNDYKELKPGIAAKYQGAVIVDLSKIIPMAALPFHPSNVYSIDDIVKNPVEILKTIEDEAHRIFGMDGVKLNLVDKIINGKVQIDQGIVGGCSGGTYENIEIMGHMSEGKSFGNGEFSLNVYPASQPIFDKLLNTGAISKLMGAGANIRTAFCGPCFGAGDVPANNALSIRHNTRNFPNREGSKPGDGQISAVALMDAKSITATALKGGILTPATEMNIPSSIEAYSYNRKIYDNRVYDGTLKPDNSVELKYGPNILDWPKMKALPENLLLKVGAVIFDDVTTTDELIPSGDTSSYRSNPERLASFTLSRKAPQYVSIAKSARELEIQRDAALKGDDKALNDIKNLFDELIGVDVSMDIIKNTGIGSVIYANKPGDGSAREQAASCQKILSGWANIAVEYATKRYRSNLVNWGMIPFVIDSADMVDFKDEDFILILNIRYALENGADNITAKVLSTGTEINLKMPDMSQSERDILLDGCLINYYKK